MRNQISLTLDYLSIEELLVYIEEPYQTACFKLLRDNYELFRGAYGSTHNHQAWRGGYLDHLVEGMNYARHLYAFDSAFGRDIPFSLSDVLLVFFLHDLEKPWRIQIDDSGKTSNREGLRSKESYRLFREEKLAEYGISLDKKLFNAFTYVEGEYTDYSNKRRVMNELAAFCHKVDTWSARGWPDYPKASGDGWYGSFRHNM